MATDCSSVKPSPCNRFTNLSVSKWWSRCRWAVAWKRRERTGLGLAGDGRRGDDSPLKLVRELCHGGAVLAARSAAKGRVAREAVSGAFQLSRGSRNRGSISAAMKFDVATVRGTESLDCCEKSVAGQVERLVCRAQFKQRSERIGLRRVRGRSFMIGCVLCK